MKDADKKPVELNLGKKGPPLKRSSRLENVKNKVQSIPVSNITSIVTSIDSLKIKDITADETSKKAPSKLSVHEELLSPRRRLTRETFSPSAMQ